MYELACIIGVVLVVAYDTMDAYRMAVYPYYSMLMKVGRVLSGCVEFHYFHHKFPHLLSKSIRRSSCIRSSLPLHRQCISPFHFTNSDCLDILLWYNICRCTPCMGRFLRHIPIPSNTLLNTSNVHNIQQWSTTNSKHSAITIITWSRRKQLRPQIIHPKSRYLRRFSESRQCH